MAKHMKEAPPEQTKRIATKRAPRERTMGDNTGHVSLPYGQVATYRYSYPSAVPRDDYYLDYDEGEVPVRGGIRTLGRGIFLLLAWALRICALGFFMLVLLDSFSISVLRPVLTRATDLVTSYLPWRDIGVLGVDTPFGGTFRGDLALISLLLFVMDWLACRVRSAMR